MRLTMKHLFWIGSVWLTGLRLALGVPAAELKPVVEIEEDVYTYTNANNGSGPMWCHGSTSLVRVGQRVFASGLELIPGVKPMNNCRLMLFERNASGWKRVWVDTKGRTREPSPLAAFRNDRVFVSTNPSLGPGDETNGYPARPDLLEFKARDATAAPKLLGPVWQGNPKFNAWSYRSLAADGPAGELILFQNVDFSHAEWTFRDRHSKWSAQGQLKWPWGAEYDPPVPVRVCYPNVAICRRAVYFCGVSDIVEPNKAWREYKHKLTGQEWDYAFRRLFYTWTPDITRKPFVAWTEIASCDKTGGGINPGDLYVANNGNAHVVWNEQAIDERLKASFFPEAKQRYSLNYAILRDGRVIQRKTIEESTADHPGIIGSGAHFQITPEHRLFLTYYASGTGADGKAVAENRVQEILRDGSMTPPVRLPLRKPFIQYFTATGRGGSSPSRTLDMLGSCQGGGNAISYARVRLY